MILKQCRRCETTKTIECFAKNKGTKDGHVNICKDCNRGYAKQHYQENKQEYVDKAASWQKKNKRKSQKQKVESARRYREKNPEKTRAYSRQYKLDHPQQFAEYENRRRARKVTTQVEVIDRREIYARDNGCCHLCKLPVTFAEMELDHVKPLSRGGSHTRENLKVSHSTCNRRKWAKIA